MKSLLIYAMQLPGYFMIAHFVGVLFDKLLRRKGWMYFNLIPDVCRTTAKVGVALAAIGAAIQAQGSVFDQTAMVVVLQVQAWMICLLPLVLTTWGGMSLARKTCEISRI
jgi:hypothetical protein